MVKTLVDNEVCSVLDRGVNSFGPRYAITIKALAGGPYEGLVYGIPDGEGGVDTVATDGIPKAFRLLSESFARMVLRDLLA